MVRDWLTSALDHYNVVSKICLDERRNHGFVDGRWCERKCGILEGPNHTSSRHPSQTTTSCTSLATFSLRRLSRYTLPFALSSEYSCATLLKDWPSCKYELEPLPINSARVQNLYFLQSFCCFGVLLTEYMSYIDSCGCL